MAVFQERTKSPPVSDALMMCVKILLRRASVIRSLKMLVGIGSSSSRLRLHLSLLFSGSPQRS